MAALVGAIGSPSRALAQPAETLLLTPPAGNTLFLSTTGVGYQDYICLPTAANPSVTAWTFERPESGLSVPLFGNKTLEVAENVLTPVPIPATTPRTSCVEAADGTHQYCPAFRSPADLSAVWSTTIQSVPAGNSAICPNAGAIACLLLQTITTSPGEVGPGLLGRVTYVQRIETSGGAAPTTACSSGQVEQVPYQATYRFFAAT